MPALPQLTQLLVAIENQVVPPDALLAQLPINRWPSNPEHPLICAFARGSMDAICAIIPHCSELTLATLAPDAAREAAALGDPQRLKLALSFPGITAKTLRSVRGPHPLCRAAEAGSLACVQLLAPYSDLLRLAREGSNPLVSAAEAGSESCIAFLLDQEAALARVATHSGATALMWALPHARCVRLLLPHSDLRARCEMGRNALMKAAFAGADNCASLLATKEGALAQDRHGENALMIAASMQHLGCVSMLLPLTDLDQRDMAGRTAPERARTCGNLDIVERIEAVALARLEQRELAQALPATRSPSRKLRV